MDMKFIIKQTEFNYKLELNPGSYQNLTKRKNINPKAVFSHKEKYEGQIALLYDYLSNPKWIVLKGWKVEQNSKNLKKVELMVSKK